jgi:hypothetical protein
VRPALGTSPELPHDLNDQADENAWRVKTAFDDGAGLLAATAGMGLEGVVAETGHVATGPPAHPYWRKMKHRTYGWFDLLGWRAPFGRNPGGCWPAEPAG